MRISDWSSDVCSSDLSGDVTALKLADGREVAGDIFVDCSGFRSLMLGQALGEDWEDWSHWLPCDRAAAMPTEHVEADIQPYTSVHAMPGGLRWSIPLQQRIGQSEERRSGTEGFST